MRTLITSTLYVATLHFTVAYVSEKLSYTLRVILLVHTPFRKNTYNYYIQQSQDSDTHTCIHVLHVHHAIRINITLFTPMGNVCTFIIPDMR